MVVNAARFSLKFWGLLAAAGVALALASPSSYAQAQAGIYTPGEPIVTGFPGVVPPDPALTSGDPLDKTFIDLNGASMTIEQLQPNGPPQGQVIPSPTVFAAKAKDIGQVFGIALDDATIPNIYLTATSAFGLNLVVTGPDGTPVRSKTGAAGATFMPGQWGTAGGATGSPGSIWKVDGTTGDISLFSTIAADSGAGLGDIVFDPATEQFFVSDLDTGLIYRLGLDGTILGTFDHGVAGRPAHGLAAVADDGSEMSITNPAFSSEDPKTWGFTQADRKVFGLAVHDGRLYYAVAAGPSIWSVGINPNGSFGDPRWELDVARLPSADEITNIVFDAVGRMVLAQRGAQVGSYDYSVFATPRTSSVVRYTRELPDDPATPSAWVATPDTYAIGFRPDGNNASGGIALGYGYDAASKSIGGACSAYLWSTADSLRDDPSLASQPGAPAQVAGLQSNDENLVRPQNDPPQHAYFTDYDGNTGDDEAQFQGHVGDVEIWQDCQRAPGVAAAGGQPGGYQPPAAFLPPPGYTPPKSFDLSLSKWAEPAYCADDGQDWSCKFVIRAKNAGTTPYWGPVTIDDWLPANPAGASMDFGPASQWNCTANGSTSYQCVSNGPQLLFPGDSIDLKETVKLPKSYAQCVLDNDARLVWPFAQDDNPADDFASATELIDQQQCGKTPGNTNDLNLSKTGLTTCEPDPNNAGMYECDYVLTVSNVGPGPFNGPLTVTDKLPAGMTNVQTSSTSLTCSTSGTTVTCSLPNPAVDTPLGASWTATIVGDVPAADANGKPICNVNNVADITVPTPGDPVVDTVISNDHSEWPSTVDNPKCQSTPGNPPNITVTKTLAGCQTGTIAQTNVAGFLCTWDIVFTNGGTSEYTGPLTFTDTTPNAIISSWAGFADCTGPADNTACNFPPGNNLPAGPSDIPTQTFYAASPTLCGVDNTIDITVPAPGSSATAHADLSSLNPACGQGPAAALTLTKTAISCAAVLHDMPEEWACYQVAIKNDGSANYSGPLTFSDQLSTPSQDVKIRGAQESDSVCTPATGGYTCSSSANISLDPQQVETYEVDAGYTDSSGGCQVTNTAALMTPSSGPTSSATATLTGSECRQDHKAPPPTAQQCPLGSRAPISAAAPDGCCLNGGTWNGRACSTTGHPKPLYPNLTISKLPGACTYHVGENNFLCTFHIVVGNTGTAGVASVTVVDQPVISQGVQLIRDGAICKGNTCFISWLPPGGTSTILATLVTSANAMKLNHCKITNTARITHPFPGASASATDVVPINDPACVQPMPPPSSNGGPAATPPNTGRKPPLHLVPGIVLQCPAHSSGKYPACACDRGYHRDRSTKTCVPNSTPSGKPPISLPKVPPVIVPRCPPHSIGKPPACFCVRGYVGYPNCTPLQFRPGIILHPGILPRFPGNRPGPAAPR